MSDFFNMLLNLHNLEGEELTINLDNVVDFYPTELVINGYPRRITTFDYVKGKEQEVREDYNKILDLINNVENILSVQ